MISRTPLYRIERGDPVVSMGSVAMVQDVKPRVLTTLIDEHDGTGSIELALSVAGHFALSLEQARKVVREVNRAVAQWRKVAAAFGPRKAELDRMASAFAP